jgi:hypothetical protein
LSFDFISGDSLAFDLVVRGVTADDSDSASDSISVFGAISTGSTVDDPDNFLFFALGAVELLPVGVFMTGLTENE